MRLECEKWKWFCLSMVISPFLGWIIYIFACGCFAAHRLIKWNTTEWIIKLIGSQLSGLCFFGCKLQIHRIKSTHSYLSEFTQKYWINRRNHIVIGPWILAVDIGGGVFAAVFVLCHNVNLLQLYHRCNLLQLIWTHSMCCLARVNLCHRRRSVISVWKLIHSKAIAISIHEPLYRRRRRRRANRRHKKELQKMNVYFKSVYWTTFRYWSMCNSAVAMKWEWVKENKIAANEQTIWTLLYACQDWKFYDPIFLALHMEQKRIWYELASGRAVARTCSIEPAHKKHTYSHAYHQQFTF